MKKLISYSLFEPKFLPQHRSWDAWKNNQARYWFNVPAVIILNEILFPEYNLVFYVSKNVWDNPLSEVFRAFPKVKVQTIERDYDLTEPAIWRMMPLWDRGVSVLLPRDIDSLPTLEEYKYVRAFEDSQCVVGTIRSHENHHGVFCRMLAGLSAFKPDLITPQIKGFNFDMYYASRPDEYGSDQNLMIRTFTSEESFTKTSFLDCKINRQENDQEFACIHANLESIEVPNLVRDVLAVTATTTGTSWLGEPCDSRGMLLNYLLDLKPQYKKNLSINDKISSFYGVAT